VYDDQLRQEDKGKNATNMYERRVARKKNKVKLNRELVRTASPETMIENRERKNEPHIRGCTWLVTYSIQTRVSSEDIVKYAMKSATFAGLRRLCEAVLQRTSILDIGDALARSRGTHRAHRHGR
jgi:hypothetical protein